MVKVQGQCPACGRESLFLGDGGYVTCAILECPQPEAASDLLLHSFMASRAAGRQGA